MAESSAAAPTIMPKIDTAIGTIVWVRRRNESWWPGRILGVEELSATHLMSPRSGTPVKLLGRDDASMLILGHGRKARKDSAETSALFEKKSTEQFLIVVSDDLQADSGTVQPSVIANSCYPLIGEFEEKFWLWSNYVSAKGSIGLTELPLTIIDLECGEYTESCRGNEVFSDYLQNYICTEDEDEDTFQKFKARERKKPSFQGQLLDSIKESPISNPIVK